MPRGKRINLPPLDLSRYNNEEKLSPDIFAILKNALCVYNGDAKKVAELYNIKEEHVNRVLAKDYLQITQIINSQMRSKDLDNGIDSAITLLSKHVSEIKKANKDSNLLKDSSISQLTRITDRFLNSKKSYNDTYSVLVNEMIDQQLKERQVNVLENGKPEDNTEYLQNQNTVASMMEDYLAAKVDKSVTMVNVKTYEVKKFTGDRARQDAEKFLGCVGHLSDICRQKSPYRGEWIVCYDGKRNITNNREY